LRTIAGFSQPDEGRVLVDGVDMTGIPPHKRNLGIVFQNYALFPHLTVLANVEFGLRMRRVTRSESREAVSEALELVGIERLSNRRPHELSGGEQQRVALARALVIRPSLLLLDEPLSALDRKIRQELQVELKRVQHQTKITTIMVTHDQEEVIYLADELLVLESGRVRQVGAPEDVYRDPEDVFVAGFMGASNVWSGTRRLKDGRVVADLGSVFLELAPSGSENGSRSNGVTEERIIVSVRPESVVLEQPTGDTGLPATEARPARLSGLVEEVEFVGPLARVRVRAGDLILTSLQLARTVRTYHEGMAVLVSIDPNDIKWYSDSTERNQ
jgi:ABC-type Fe3+/spermidine/putrescine transport system ATPase subunit